MKVLPSVWENCIVFLARRSHLGSPKPQVLPQNLWSLTRYLILLISNDILLVHYRHSMQLYLSYASYPFPLVCIVMHISKSLVSFIILQFYYHHASHFFFLAVYCDAHVWETEIVHFFLSFVLGILISSFDAFEICMSEVFADGVECYIEMYKIHICPWALKLCIIDEGNVAIRGVSL